MKSTRDEWPGVDDVFEGDEYRYRDALIPILAGTGGVIVLMAAWILIGWTITNG